ncbi:MAG: Ig-like domain-containing protein, partial [Gemmatimonadaceae bacterium]
TFANLPPAVLRGETMRLQVAAARRGTVSVSQRIPGEAWTTQTVPVDARTGLATIEVGPLRGDLSVVASDGRSASDTVVVNVTDRPFVGAVSMRATYPGYLGRASEALAAGEPARVPQGTVIDISGRASTALRAVRLTANGTGGDTVAFRVNDRAFDGRMHATKSGRYAWMASGAAGPIADVPPPLELEVVPDSAPHVELVSPALDTIVAGDDKITLRATASDDHGIARVDVVSWKQGPTGSATAQASQKLADGSSTVWDGTTVIDLRLHGLKPGDALHVKVVATDNSPWAQRGESRELLLKIPTMEERRALARASMDSAVSQVQSAAQAEKSLQERTSDAARDRSQRNTASNPSAANGADKKGTLSFDAAEKAKAVAKDQRALTDQVKELQKTAAGLEQQLKQAGALDSSLARQLQEAQAMLRDALTPELLAQMSKLDTATQQLSQQQAQMSLKDLQALQQKLREQLEKSAEMLKRAALEGSMQTLKDEAKDIADRDRSLADSSVGTAGDPQKSDAQKAAAKQLADRSQRFEDEVKKLQTRLEQNKADAGAAGAEEARKQAGASQESMRQAAGDKGQAGDKSPGAEKSPQGGSGMEQHERDGAAQMSRASDAMKQARESQVNEWKSELTNALDQSIQEMLQMARQEQSLEQKAQSGQAKPDELRGEQSAVKQGLDNSAAKLQQQGQKSSLLSGRSERAVAEAQQKVSEAMQQTSDARSARQSAGALSDAADALNRAASSLARDREKANTSSSATGFSEMMQELRDAAKKQGSINAQAQGMLPGPGQPMSAQQQATSRALAREQRQVAQQLDDVGDAVGGDRAAQLAKEAKQLADALDGGRIDPGTIARQQQLFRRLLDADKSREKDEREDTNKREATSAKPGNELAPDNKSSTGRAAIKFREPTWDELRGLSADERRAILEYFKRINASTPNP